MKTLAIIDVQNMFYRAFWGTDPLVTSYGRPVQGIHGFLSILTATLKAINPDYIALALESKGKSFRKDIDPLYKSNRQEPSQELIDQKELLSDLLKALNYPTFQAEGFEADDVIGTLATRAKENGLKVIIVSSDKDFSQLVDENITIYDSMKNLHIGKEEVLAKHGVLPEKFVDYLAIVGDSSDGYKGVEGIGPKGAVSLLSEFGSIESIYSNIDKVKGKNKDKLIASTSSAFLSKKLAKIETNIPLTGFSIPESILFNGYNKEELRKFLSTLELKHHLSNLLGSETVELGGVQIGIRG